MTMEDYMKNAERTFRGDTPSGYLENGALGLAGEAGEVCDLVKKWMFQGHELERERIVEELGDVLWYIALTARGCGSNLETVARMNIKKLRARYPEGFDPERSRARYE